MNATLEAMARALFKSWFVDFDPVQAKLEGRDTGLQKEIADLFPDRLVDSELGRIPEGWKSTRLDNVATITKGRSYRRQELVASDTALVTLKSFARGGGYRAEGLKSFGGVYKSEQVVRPGEVIVACTDVTQAAEVVGRSAVVGEDVIISNAGRFVGRLDPATEERCTRTRVRLLRHRNKRFRSARPGAYYGNDCLASLQRCGRVLPVRPAAKAVDGTFWTFRRFTARPNPGQCIRS